MDAIPKIITFFGHNTPYVSFFGAIVGGEETLILLSIYTAKGIFNFVYVLLFFYLGIMVSDTLWYFIGTSKVFAWFMKFKFIASSYNHWGRLLDTATQKNDFQALFFTKFLYGLRIPTIMYLARERLILRQFLKYSAPTNFIWMLIIFFIGWTSGKGIETAINISDNIFLEIFLVGCVMVLFMLIMKILSRKTKQWLKKT